MVRARVVPLISLLFCVIASAADWPQWRGPNRDGKSAETGLLASWPAGGPRLVWKAQGLGEGYSRSAVVGSRLYTQGQQGDQAVRPCPRRQHRQTALEDAIRPLVSATTRATVPAVHRRSTETGCMRWPATVCSCASRSEPASVSGDTTSARRFGGSVPRWGYSESPLVDGDRVIVTPGGRGASVVALNKATGDLVWKSQDDAAGYSSAIPFDAGGTRGLAILTASAAIGLNMKNGELAVAVPQGRQQRREHRHTHCVRWARVRFHRLRHGLRAAEARLRRAARSRPPRSISIGTCATTTLPRCWWGTTCTDSRAAFSPP